MKTYLNHLGVICALGDGVAAVREQLFAGTSPGMRSTEQYSPCHPRTLGLVDAELPALDHHPMQLRSRNNALLLHALEQIRPAVEALKAKTPAHRIAVILGTSTTGMAESEEAHQFQCQEGRFPERFHYAQQELGSPARFLSAELGVTGPAYVISTACTSSAKALASAARLLQAGLADAVLAGGVDTLCRFTVAGFAALESIDDAPCNPFSANRRGINIGEGAALFIVSRESGPVCLAGWGESSDGHHISAPDPSANGAKLAIGKALQRARLAAADIGYINLHGTATQQNDAMESRAVAELLPGVPASSTKPLTGHTLGAAGAIEAGLCWLTLTDQAGRLPPHHWDGVPDPALPALPFVAPGSTSSTVRAVISNSFAFGGNNIALVLTR
ncbi:MAG: beta-ketoacyl-[acyl-carrier-protein] synthase [Proteobacteria bacterium]|nr:beta-ketoacyl-[acyl-carrier-protein] synthase [Pseudomonadota bacterium]